MAPDIDSSIGVCLVGDFQRRYRKIGAEFQQSDRTVASEMADLVKVESQLFGQSQKVNGQRSKSTVD